MSNDTQSLSPEDRVTIWLNHEADRDMIEDAERQRYIDASRGTLRASLMRLGFATDDLAASGPVGLVVAFVFLGWRKGDMRYRLDLLEGFPA